MKVRGQYFAVVASVVINCVPSLRGQSEGVGYCWVFGFEVASTDLAQPAVKRARAVTPDIISFILEAICI